MIRNHDNFFGFSVFSIFLHAYRREIEKTILRTQFILQLVLMLSCYLYYIMTNIILRVRVKRCDIGLTLTNLRHTCLARVTSGAPRH